MYLNKSAKRTPQLSIINYQLSIIYQQDLTLLIKSAVEKRRKNFLQHPLLEVCGKTSPLPVEKKPLGL